MHRPVETAVTGGTGLLKVDTHCSYVCSKQKNSIWCLSVFTVALWVMTPWSLARGSHPLSCECSASVFRVGYWGCCSSAGSYPSASLRGVIRPKTEISRTVAPHRATAEPIEQAPHLVPSFHLCQGFLSRRSKLTKKTVGCTQQRAKTEVTDVTLHAGNSCVVFRGGYCP